MTGKRFHSYDVLYNYETQQNDTVYSAPLMDDTTARRYIPDTPRSFRIYHDARMGYLKSPYDAMLMTLDIIFNGVKHGETADNSRH